MPRTCSPERKAGKWPAKLILGTNWEEKGEHKEGRILLCWGSLHYSQACVPAMRFIYGPNKVEQNILCSRLQSGLLWLEMKLKMCLRICRGRGEREGVQSRSTDLSLFLFPKSQKVSTAVFITACSHHTEDIFCSMQKKSLSIFRFFGRVIL